MKKELAMAIALAAMTNGALAAEQDMPKYTLDTLVVTATKTDVKDLETPAMTHIFTQQDIQRLGVTNVMDVLANVPGAVITPPVGMGGTIGFRGLAKNTVNAAILIDGIPLNAQGAANLEAINVDAIEKIEVIKGAGAVLYGSDAMAGIINIITKDSSSNKVTLGGGKDGKRYGALNVNADKLNVSYARDQIKERGFLSRTHSTEGYEYAKDSLNLKYKFDEHLKMQYLYTKQEDNYSWVKRHELDKNDYDFNVFNLNYQNNDLYVNAYGRRFTFGSKGWNMDTGMRLPSSGDDVIKNYGAEVRNKWDLGKTQLTAGAVFDREEADYSGIIRNRNNGALYALGEIPVAEKVDLLLGTRYQMVDDLENELCPQVQVIYKADATQSFYVNANKSFRVPTIKEQYNTNSSTFIPNPDLKPETAWTYELGWKKQFEDSSVKLALYKLDVKDRIYSVKTGLQNENGDDISTPTNADKFENTGLEGVYEQTIDNNWYYNIGFAISNPKQSNKSNVMQKVDYRYNVNGLVGYRNRDLTANVSVQHIWDRTETWGVMPPDLWNVNFNMKYAVDKNSEIKLMINNLLDRDDWVSNAGSYLPNRNFTLYYSYKF